MTWLILFALSVAALILRPRRGLAYAETHFRFVKGATRLYRPLPEIYFDCPWRVTRGERIPLALLVKDGDRFPVILDDLEVFLSDGRRTERRALGDGVAGDLRFPQLVRQSYGYFVLEVTIPDSLTGDLTLLPRLRATVDGTSHEFGVTSHDAFSLEPLRLHVADEPLPTRNGWTYVETHTHSWQTSDQVEFGAPPEVMARMARAIGIRWVFVTDHSFDLDVPAGRWFGFDPERTRWRTLEGELKAINVRDEGVTLFRAEEVSCGTEAGKNVHLLVYGVPEMIPGRGDGVKQRKCWQNAPDLTLREVLSMVRQHGGLAFPAHPMVRHSPMERFLLNRGEWHTNDLILDYDGWELWNTDGVESFERARREWIRLLLEGWQYPIIAGSDAHGDFNRTRCIGVPFFTLAEFFREAFGKPRTGVYTPDGSAESVFDALRAGRCFVTNGPFATLTVASERTTVGMSEAIHGREFVVTVDACSTAEFGEITRVVLCVGAVGGEERRVLLGQGLGYDRQLVGRVTLTEPGYLRAEVEAGRGEVATCAFTNPVWINYDRDLRRRRRVIA
jgi:hypothetical protein